MTDTQYKTFEQNTAESDKTEAFVVEYLKKKGYSDARRISSRIYFPYFDVVIPSQSLTIEVKYDRASAKSNNVAIEISEKDGKPSGLYLTKALFYYHIYMYGDVWYMGIASVNELKYAIEHEYGVAGYGITQNNFKSKCALINKDDFQVKCIETVRLSKY